jgi:hypothetical protein
MKKIHKSCFFMFMIDNIIPVSIALGEIASFKQRRTAWNCPGIALKTQSNAGQAGPAKASKIW